MRVKSLILCLFVLIQIICVNVCATEVSFDYSTLVDENGVAVIPSTIDGMTVTEIPPKAFYGNADLKKVVIPETVTKISNYAFYKCSSLSEIVFSDNITTIGINAFAKCDMLTAVTMPKKLENVSEYAFMNCKNLSSITFSESTKATIDFFGKNITYVNVMRNMSVSCDCEGVDAEPVVTPNVGILASDDILAVDQACVDLVYAMSEDEHKALVERIETRHGHRQLSYMKELGMGNDKYILIDLDNDEVRIYPKKAVEGLKPFKLIKPE